MRQRIVEKLMHVLFFIAACASVLAVVLISAIVICGLDALFSLVIKLLIKA